MTFIPTGLSGDPTYLPVTADDSLSVAILVEGLGVVLALVIVLCFLLTISRIAYNGVLRLQAEESVKTDAPRIVTFLLKLIIPSTEEQENLIGDLLEEYNQFPSKLSAHLWLYKQVLKSVLPLIYKSVKSRLAARFGERIG
jgi:hypothetical protein